MEEKQASKRAVAKAGGNVMQEVAEESEEADENEVSE